MRDASVLSGYLVDDSLFFQVLCDLPTSSIPTILDEYRRDQDVLRKAFVSTDIYDKRPEPICTLQEEMQPPSKRPSVAK